mmetsp:Transcript_117049/g.331276  ORF Transcript_117049/g.331276 Transcript_117049/m.331276 type:complete len:215 (-) Transcript_117049:12-656(-)
MLDLWHGELLDTGGFTEAWPQREQHLGGQRGAEVDQVSLVPADFAADFLHALRSAPLEVVRDRVPEAFDGHWDLRHQVILAPDFQALDLVLVTPLAEKGNVGGSDGQSAVWFHRLQQRLELLLFLARQDNSSPQAFVHATGKHLPKDGRGEHQDNGVDVERLALHNDLEIRVQRIGGATSSKLFCRTFAAGVPHGVGCRHGWAWRSRGSVDVSA